MSRRLKNGAQSAEGHCVQLDEAMRKRAACSCLQLLIHQGWSELCALFARLLFLGPAAHATLAAAETAQSRKQDDEEEHRLQDEDDAVDAREPPDEIRVAQRTIVPDARGLWRDARDAAQRPIEHVLRVTNLHS